MNDQSHNKENIIREQHFAPEIADEIQLGYYRCSRNGKTVEVNDLLTNIFEFKTHEDLINSGIPDKLNRTILEKQKAAGESSESMIDSLSMKTKMAREVWLEVRSRVVNDDHGHPVFHEGFVREISSERLAREQFKNEITSLETMNEELQRGLQRGIEFSEKLLKEGSFPAAEEHTETHLTLNKKILIIDDDNDITTVFSEFFSEKGLIVQTADNGRDAFRIYHNFHPDVVLSDIMMPGMDGLTLQEKIRDLNNEQPIVLVTGEKSKEAAKDLLSSMGIPLLFKPVNIRTDLWNTVKSLLEKQSQS